MGANQSRKHVARRAAASIYQCPHVCSHCREQAKELLDLLAGPKPEQIEQDHAWTIEVFSRAFNRATGGLYLVTAADVKAIQFLLKAGAKRSDTLARLTLAFKDPWFIDHCSLATFVYRMWNSLARRAQAR